MPAFRTRSAPLEGDITQRQPTPTRTPRRSRIQIFGTGGLALRAETRTRPNTPMSPTIHIRANRRRPCKLARHRMNIRYSPVHDLGQGERLSSDDNSHGTIGYDMSSSLVFFLLII